MSKLNGHSRISRERAHRSRKWLTRSIRCAQDATVTGCRASSDPLAKAKSTSAFIRTTLRLQSQGTSLIRRRQGRQDQAEASLVSAKKIKKQNTVKKNNELHGRTDALACHTSTSEIHCRKVRMLEKRPCLQAKMVA